MSASSPPSGPRPLAPGEGARASNTAVTGAIRKAAQSTGASFEYLLATAKVESDLNPNLTMRSSTATGLFQFLEQTWLGVMKSAGRAFGYGQYADAITQTKSGYYVVEDAGLRAEMMKLRKDPAVNAAMGGVFTQQNAAVVSKRIGRKPTDGELYIAHFFGPYAASQVITMAKRNPTANAAEIFPAAAAANRPIFYDQQGNARSVAGVYSELVRRYQVARASPTPGLAPAAASAAAPASPAALAANPALAVAPKVMARAELSDTAGITAAFAAANPAPLPATFVRSEGAPVTPVTAADAPLALQPAGRSEPTSMFHSLFETEPRPAGVSSVVSELWGAPAARARAQAADAVPTPVASELPATSTSNNASSNRVGPSVPREPTRDPPREIPPAFRRGFNGRI
jgi:hypothetical protein